MIARDGENVSLWQNIHGYVPVPSSVNAGEYDVAIIGGGITGITTAWLLQKEGKKCIVLEGKSLCYGTTGGTTAHLNTLLDTPYTTIIKKFGEDNARLVAQSAAEAISFIKSNVEELSIDCGFEEVSAFLFSQDETQSKELDDIYEACQKAGLEVSFTSANPVPIPFDKIMEVKGQAKFHPTRYVQALASDFENAGGVILHGCRITRIAEGENYVELESEYEIGLYRAQSVIYATHIPPGVNLLHLKCAPWRSYAMAVKLKDSQYPEGLIYDMYDPYHYYRTQVVDGQPYLIAGGEDHKTGHEENTELSFRSLESHIRKHFDVGSIDYKWSSQYFEPVDGLPYIGHLPGFNKRVYVATGYSGNGMIFSTVAAHILTDDILGRESLYKDLYSAERIKPVAAFADFVKNNADVVRQFVGKWFSTEELEELVELSPGEGKVVRYKDEVIALSKDSSGNLHAVSPTCTHMKCSVTWNESEQSWDCPCHGARYSPDGKVLTGPASKDLEPVELLKSVENNQLR